jgi:acetyl-CoA synthetase
MSSQKSKKAASDHAAELAVVRKPSKEFSKKARIGSMAEYEKLYKQSIDKPEKFWASEAKELLWQKPFSKVRKWKAPDAEWFIGGKLNVAENCVDRHAFGPRANKAAIIWEGEPGDKRTITYSQLHREVCKFANVMLARGVKGARPLALPNPVRALGLEGMLPEALRGGAFDTPFLDEELRISRGDRGELRVFVRA